MLSKTSYAGSNQSLFQIFTDGDGNIIVTFASQWVNYPNFMATKEDVNFSSFRATKNIGGFLEFVMLMPGYIFAGDAQTITNIIEKDLIPYLERQEKITFRKVQNGTSAG